MFIHQSRLKHILPPEAYWTQGQYGAELERLFMPSWHLVGSRADLPNPGAFLSLDLLGKPLLVCNCDGEIHAFLNVCAHRHSMLTNEKKGSSPRIRCQYHGWEYDKHGRTGKVPEAKCFSPFERDRARLQKFRTGTCGELIFVSLSEDGPSLADFLSHAFDEIAHDFAHPWRQCWTWQYDFPANWKIPVENSLETYHLTCVHAKTFGENPAEEYCTHECGDQYTTFKLDIQYHKSNPLQKLVLRILGEASTSIYTHHHAFPGFISTKSDVLRMAQSVWPTSPTMSHTVIRLYSLRGDRKNPLASLVAWMAAGFGRAETERIIMEDVRLFPGVQRGNECAVHDGVLGTREERVYLFQQYVARQCSDSEKVGSYGMKV